MLLNEKHNIKHFYRAVEFISRLTGSKLPHERFKLIALDEYKALSKEEVEVKTLKDSYLFLINNVNQVLTKDIIKKAYYLLTDITLSDDITNKILKTYYENYDESPHYLAALNHFAVVDNVSERKIEFAFIISNLIMLNRNRNPLIPYEMMYEKYHDAIKNKDINKLMYVFAAFEAKDREIKENKDLKLEDIFYIIKENRSQIKNKYQVSKLYLYGSFAKGKTTIKSDLDILVIFKEQTFNYQKVSLQEELRKYLSDKLNIYVDLIDFSKAMDLMDICEMENIITLI